VAGPGDGSACRSTGGQVHCRVQVGGLDGEEPGPWVVRLVKRSASPVDIEVTVGFGRRCRRSSPGCNPSCWSPLAVPR
jgi:hypothetical protein